MLGYKTGLLKYKTFNLQQDRVERHKVLSSVNIQQASANHHLQSKRRGFFDSHKQELFVHSKLGKRFSNSSWIYKTNCKMKMNKYKLNFSTQLLSWIYIFLPHLASSLCQDKHWYIIIVFVSKFAKF